MLNLNEITAYYIEITFQEELKKIIYSSFSLLEAFGKTFYEDKYVDLISKTDTTDNDFKRDNFILKLKKDIYELLTEHSIYIQDDAEITLNELNEIAHFLFIVQRLEDYTEVSYIINSELSNKKKLIALISRYSFLSEIRLMELLGVVEYSLINALKTFIEDKHPEEEESIDRKRLRHIKHFSNFIDNTDCLGITLYNNGYTNVTLKELTSLLTMDISGYIDKIIVTKSAQASLDVLSLLITTKDDYNIPMLKFNKNISLFTNKSENITKLSNTIINMLNDFNSYVNAQEESEKLNAN